MNHIDTKVEEKFVKHYLNRIIERGKGTGPEGLWCAGVKPQRTYFIGGLAPKREQESIERRRLHERYSPSSCGLEFRILDHRGYIQVACAFSIYILSYAPFKKLPDASVGAVCLPRYYRRYRVNFQSEQVSLEEVLNDLEKYSKQWTCVLNEHIAAEIELAAQSPYTVLEAQVKEGKSIEDTNVEPEYTESEEKYLAFLKSLERGSPRVPAWRVELEIESKLDPAAERLRIFLVNVTKEPEMSKYPDQDGGIYGVDLSCMCDEFYPVPISLHRSSRNDYRYQFTSHGRGINCSLTEEKLGSSKLDLRTDFAPSHEQKRYLPEEKGYQLYFSDLSKEPVMALEPIVKGMKKYASQWKDRIASKHDGIKTEKDQIQARDYLEKFFREIHRFEQGINILKRKDTLGKHLQEAFKLMNETFEQLDQWRKERMGKRFRGWRMFQIIFIVTNLTELLDRAENRGQEAPAELLFFPTGGGKTEAMMGIVVTALFFDRFRGRKRGVTSWMRFPLRLLTFQQMQRYLDITAAAEIVREKALKRFSSLGLGDPFKIGYYGGRDNSPNDLYRYDSQSSWAYRVAKELSQEQGYKVQTRDVTGLEVLKRYPEAFLRYRMVGDCPFCGAEESVTIVADDKAKALRHRCRSCGKTLPLVIVDTDIYAEIPAILVGTLDKIANIGFRLGARTLFGKSDGLCKKHGYGTFGRCLKHDFKACGHADWVSFKKEHLFDPAISISFQDELHLLNEELGCFDAHYEAILDALCEEAGSIKPKVLAASATIEGAKNQVDHLYRRRLERFPGEGPQLRETFYAKEQDQLQRIFCGLKPSGMQPLDMTMALIGALSLENDLLREDRGKAQTDAKYDFLIKLSNDDYQKLVDRHCLLVPYVNSKPDGAEIERSIDEQVQDTLDRSNAKPLYPPEMLTGDTEMPDVKAILRRMETPRYLATEENGLDIVIATSMISHGVDVDRLNLMVFYSFPRSTAEYIQATSRAGRTYPGIVFVVLKASSQRDRSYFRHFAEVHYALDQMVEAVPIDRFAANAADHTVPGVALAWLIGAEADRLRQEGKLNLNDARGLDAASTLRRFVANEENIMQNILYDPLGKIYEVSNPQAAHFAHTIRRKLLELENNLARVDEHARSIPNALNFTSTRVMTSLRDVDPGVKIEIENRVHRK